MNSHPVMGVELRQLVGCRRLEFWDSIMNHPQSVDEAEAIRVYSCLEGAFMYQGANRIVCDQQTIQFLNHAQVYGFRTARHRDGREVK